MASYPTEEEYGYEHSRFEKDGDENVYNVLKEPRMCRNNNMSFAARKYRKVEFHDCGQIQEDMGTLKGSFLQLDGKVEDSNAEVMKEIKDVKENLSKVNKDVDEVKVMMSQMLEKFNMLELLSKLSCPTEGMFNTPREDILVAGGWGAKHTEIFSWEKNGWYEILQMNKGHMGASSFIYNDHLFVVGGWTETIETLDLNELPLKWMKFLDELPYKSLLSSNCCLPTACHLHWWI